MTPLFLFVLFCCFGFTFLSPLPDIVSDVTSYSECSGMLLKWQFIESVLGCLISLVASKSF